MIKSLKSRIPDPLYKEYLSSIRSISLLCRNIKCDKDKLRSPFFMIILSGGLHVARVAIKYIPDDQDLILIFNGCEEWEKRWAHSNLKFSGSISFPYTLPHYLIINFLLQTIKQPFGLIDYDCFVLNPEYFARIRNISLNNSFSSYYGYKNEYMDVVFPETFILFINQPVIAQIMKTYHVDASEKKWNEIHENVKNKFIEAGLSQNHLIESYKNFFDTLRVIMALCVIEDKNFYFPELFSQFETTKIFHVGSASKFNKVAKPWDLRAAYFWNKALEQEQDQWLASKYFSKYGHRSTNDILENYLKVKQKWELDFVNAVDRVLLSRF